MFFNTYKRMIMEIGERDEKIIQRINERHPQDEVSQFFTSLGIKKTDHEELEKDKPPNPGEFMNIEINGE